ncbi:MAG: hypothetical protein R6X19_06295 [Kiritimatiellia bacterium]
MRNGIGFVGGVVALALCGSTMAASWEVAEQPDLGKVLAAAPQLPTEQVGKPMRSTTRGSLMYAYDRKRGHVHLLQWYFRAYPGPTTGVIINTGTGDIKTVAIPDNLQIHMAATQIGPDGKLYIVTPWWYQAERKGMNLFVYDPTDGSFEDRGVIAPQLGYEHRQLIIGTNGKLYGASTYPGRWQAGLFEIDTETGKVTDFGPFGPAYTPACWSWGLAADDTHAYVYTVHNPRRLIALNRETRQSEVLLTAKNDGGKIGLRQHRHGVSVTAEGLIDAGQEKGRYWLLNGKLIPRTDDNPPWDGPLDGKPRVEFPPDLIEVFTENTMPLPDGTAEIWYRGAKAAAVSDTAVAEDRGWKRARFQVSVYPIRTQYAVELDDGRIFCGSSGYHGGYFVYTPATGETEFLGKLSGLSQYARIVHDGKVYMSGYPSSPLYIYDPTKPWTANKWLEPGQRAPDAFSRQNNPWFALRLRAFAGTHYARSATRAADGKIYFGGEWARDGAHGGLSWWNPKEEKGGGFWEDLSNAAVTDLTTSDTGRLVVIATRPATDRLLNKPALEQGRMFVFDTTAGAIVRHFDPLPGFDNLGRIADAGGSRIIGLAADPESRGQSVLYGVDVASGRLVFRKTLSSPPAGDFRVGPDGWVWTFLGSALVRIDPRNAQVDVVGKTASQGHIAFSGGDIYISGGERLERIKGAYRPRPK